MRVLLLTAMMLCACLSVPGCTGADEELVCEDETTLTQYEVYECEFTGGPLAAGYTELSIEMSTTDVMVFYCSNDGEDYAEMMGGILCPETENGAAPTCPDGQSCICIDVDGTCEDGDDDWGYAGSSSPVHIITFKSDQYDNWMNCEDIDVEHSFSEANSTGASMEGEIDWDDFYVVFDHPNSCDEEVTSAVVGISFKVIAS